MAGTRTSARLLCGLLLAVAWPAGAQQARIQNAQLLPRPAAAGLEREFRELVASQTAPAWIGYAVPLPSGMRYSCCTSHWSGGCPLEGNRVLSFSTNEPQGFKLEGATHLLVLFRTEQRRAHKLRTFTDDCELDAGGLPVHWLSDVRPAASVALLASFVDASKQQSANKGVERLGWAALRALALHADPTADRALERFVAPSQPETLRRRVTSLLGSRKGRPSFEVLRRLVREDPSARVRERAARSLTRSEVPEAVDVVIGVARTDKSARVRGRALTYLARKGGNKVIKAIQEALAKDPVTDVRQRAVSALAQLPNGEGVPLLIQAARTNRNPAVRKRAMSWLGRSKDPRALAFFEEILNP